MKAATERSRTLMKANWRTHRKNQMKKWFGLLLKAKSVSEEISKETEMRILKMRFRKEKERFLRKCFGILRREADEELKRKKIEKHKNELWQKISQWQNQ